MSEPDNICPECWGYGNTMVDSRHTTCPKCHGSGVTAAPRSEGPRRMNLPFDDGWSFVVCEGVDGLLHLSSSGDGPISLDAERQLFELLRLRAEQGPPREGT